VSAYARLALGGGRAEIQSFSVPWSRETHSNGWISDQETTFPPPDILSRFASSHQSQKNPTDRQVQPANWILILCTYNVAQSILLCWFTRLYKLLSRYISRQPAYSPCIWCAGLLIWRFVNSLLICPKSFNWIQLKLLRLLGKRAMASVLRLVRPCASRMAFGLNLC
jgi:hypothetical protein